MSLYTKKMREKNKSITNQLEIMEAIDHSPYVVVGFEVEGDAPYLVPMDFGRRDAVSIYVHCAQKGRKLDLLAQNSRVSLLFVNYGGVYSLGEGIGCSLSTKFESVMAVGRAVIVDSMEEKKEAFAAMLKKHESHNLPIPEAGIAATCVIRVDMLEITGKKNPLD